MGLWFFLNCTGGGKPQPWDHPGMQRGLTPTHFESDTPYLDMFNSARNAYCYCDELEQRPKHKLVRPGER